MKTIEIKFTFLNEQKKSEFEHGLSKNQDPYGFGCYKYGCNWAALMEERVKAGESIAECWRDCGSEADTEGVTGFMYGMAAAMISDIWVHGEEFRRAYNTGMQVGTEGDRANARGSVLNPALLAMD